ncbi:MAG: ATP synthase F1 subunit epsilon [Christensenellaceae bacterium]|jgi:F-type H+-transporting ATPase subunit epsilon|nr:ATP synthase F1 subunit epsilon [Christensenellaceae bacterium]
MSIHKFAIEILTPEKTFYEGEIESLIVETSEGKIGILAGHSPLVIGLIPGVVKMKTNEEEELTAVNSEGFVEVRPGKTVILCQTMEWPEEVEPNRVAKAIEEHERILRQARSATEYKLSRATLARAFARMRVLKK